jgi:penicillin-binding protein 1C
MALSAVADADTRVLYWFVDEAYAGRAAPGETLYWHPPAAGAYRVRVVDDHGRSDERPLALTLVN